MDDRELDHLLSEWKAPGAPHDMRPRRTRASRLRWLVTGTVRVPVPAALAALLLATLWVSTSRPGAAPESEAAASQPTGGRELARYALTGTLEGFEAVLVEINIAPGPSRPEHRHTGFVLGYVADGEARFAIDRAPDAVVPTGGTFFEPDGALHSTFAAASPDESVRILVFMVVPAGSPLTGPA